MLRSSCVPFEFKFFEVCWHAKSQWNEVKILFTEFFLHCGDISPQTVFTTQMEGARKMVHLKFAYINANQYLLIISDRKKNIRFQMLPEVIYPIAGL